MAAATQRFICCCTCTLHNFPVVNAVLVPAVYPPGHAACTYITAFTQDAPSLQFIPRACFLNSPTPPHDLIILGCVYCTRQALATHWCCAAAHGPTTTPGSRTAGSTHTTAAAGTTALATAALATAAAPAGRAGPCWAVRGGAVTQHIQTICSRDSQQHCSSSGFCTGCGCCCCGYWQRWQQRQQWGCKWSQRSGGQSTFNGSGAARKQQHGR